MTSIKTVPTILRSLESILFETTRMLDALEAARDISAEERREMKRVVIDMRDRAQTLFDRVGG